MIALREEFPVGGIAGLALGLGPVMRPVLLLLALVGAACSPGGDPGGQPTPTSGASALVAQVASYDLAVGSNRIIVGLLTQDNEFVSGGEATMRLSFLGGGDASDAGSQVPATFLAIPGEEPGHAHPQAGSVEEGRGVYAGEVELDRAGPWQVDVIVDLEGETQVGTAAFQVAEEHAVPAVGDEAIPVDNLTIEDHGDADLVAVDSRGQDGGEIPDPELHDATIAETLKAGRPFVAVFSTPVFCVSQFCGPITDMIAGLEREYGDRADFIHVEVWRDFQNQVINEAAADWLLRNDDMQEPWVFLVDGDGVIRGRWDNVATPGEIEPFLRDLPPAA